MKCHDVSFCLTNGRSSKNYRFPFFCHFPTAEHCYRQKRSNGGSIPAYLDWPTGAVLMVQWTCVMLASHHIRERNQTALTNKIIENESLTTVFAVDKQYKAHTLPSYHMRHLFNTDIGQVSHGEHWGTCHWEKWGEERRTLVRNSTYICLQMSCLDIWQRWTLATLAETETSFEWMNE